MTQTSDQNGSRLDRIESLILQLATASVRHDNEMAQIRGILAQSAQRQEAIERLQQETAHSLAQSARRQEQFDQRQEAIERLQQEAARQQEESARRQEEFAQRQEGMDRWQQESARRQEAIDQQIAANQEQIANLTASIAELRNVVSDYIQGRSTL